VCNTNHKLLNLEGEVTLVTAVEYDMVKKLYVLDIDAVYAKGLLEPGPVMLQTELDKLPRADSM